MVTSPDKLTLTQAFEGAMTDMIDGMKGTPD